MTLSPGYDGVWCEETTKITQQVNKGWMSSDVKECRLYFKEIYSKMS
jgi:hypothetical protein